MIVMNTPKYALKVKIFAALIGLLLASCAPREHVLTKQDSGMAEAHYQKGLVYYSRRNYRKALEEWKAATQIDPKSRKISQALERVQYDLQHK